MGSSLSVPFLVDTLEPAVQQPRLGSYLSLPTITSQICPIFLIIKLHHSEEVSITRLQIFFCLSFNQTKTTSLF